MKKTLLILLISYTGLGSFVVVETAHANSTVIATIPVGSQASGIVAAPNGEHVYVVNGTNISKIEVRTHSVVATFPSNVDFGTSGLAISPDGTTLYCAVQGQNILDEFTTSNRKLVFSVPTGNLPQTPAVSEDGTMICVPNLNDGTVLLINNGVQSTISVGGNPDGAVFFPDGSTVYVANGNGYVSFIDTGTATVTSTVTLPTPVNGVVIDANGYTIYLPGNNAVYAVNDVTGAIVDTFSYAGKGGATNLLAYSAILSSGRQPMYVPVAGQLVNGNFVEGNTVIVFNTIAPIDTKPVDIIHIGTVIVRKAITVGNVPIRVAATPNNKFVYVANEYDGTVSVIER